MNTNFRKISYISASCVVLISAIFSLVLTIQNSLLDWSSISDEKQYILTLTPIIIYAVGFIGLTYYGIRLLLCGIKTTYKLINSPLDINMVNSIYFGALVCVNFFIPNNTLMFLDIIILILGITIAVLSAFLERNKQGQNKGRIIAFSASILMTILLFFRIWGLPIVLVICYLITSLILLVNEIYHFVNAKNINDDEKGV